MKKRFLPFSLLLVIMILGQSVMAGQGGHYVPRVKNSSSAEAFLHSMRANQQTGLIDPAWLIAASKQVENSAKSDDLVYWLSMGPDNAGGRTTSIVYSKNHNAWAYIGSMGGGVFYTWNYGISWHKIGDNLMVSSMAQAEDGTIYVGTGDCGVAYDYNGLGDYSYTNSFIGSGLYKIDPDDNTMTFVEGTEPGNDNDPTGEWSYINDVAVDGNTVIVATSDGLRYLDNGVWAYAQVGNANLTGNALEVRVGSNHTVVASVDGQIFIGTLDDMVCKSSDSDADVVNEDGVIEGIGTAAGLLDITIAPSNTQVIYAAAIDANGNHTKIYISEDNGNTWNVILPTVSNGLGHQVYDGRGLYNHGLVVDPQDSDRLYVLGYNLWFLERPQSQTNGYYMALQLSSAGSLHTGINAMVFNPADPNSAYVGTDGGIFKAEKVDNTYLSFTNCNRGYVSTRCMTVAPSGKNTRVVGGALDQGPVLIEGQEGLNNMETGELLLPELTGALYGVFDDSYNPGFCAVSLIQPKAIIATTVNGALWRTEDGGVNYDFANFIANFNSGDGPTFTGYRMPIGYWETFNDEFSANEVWFKCQKDQFAGDVVQCFSDNGGYPFDYVLPIDMHYDTVTPAHSDSLLVPDPITTKLVVPTNKSGNTYDLYYTLHGIRFDLANEWYKIATIDGYPTCMTFSADGDDLFIGTLANGLYRISNMRHAVDAYTAHPDSANFAPVVTALPVTTRCVTSIAVYPDNANKVVVTLGNYGNDNYILYSRNALSSAPTFEEKQGVGLPKMPVYSCVYTSTYDGSSNGHVLIGTDHGVYRTENIGSSSPTWTLESDNMGDVPVMDLKQQIVAQDPQYVVTIIDDVPVTTTYAGTNNVGVIYAATYGRGLFRCETYRQGSGDNVPETPVVTTEAKVSMYPNPVRDEARICFELNNSTMVSYQVYDMSGRMVMMENLGSFAQGKHEVNVSMNGLSKGSYVLRLNAGNNTSSAKFMVF